MKYLLDTNICIYLIKKKPESVIQRLEALPPTDVCLSSIAFFEMMFGAAKSQFPERNSQTAVDFFSLYETLTFDNQDAIVAGYIRADLAKQGRIIGPYDLQIAGQAKRRGLTLVTNNTKEFERVDGLQLENWVV